MDSSCYTPQFGRLKPDWPLTGIEVLQAVALQQETRASASRNTVQCHFSHVRIRHKTEVTTFQKETGFESRCSECKIPAYEIQPANM